MAMIEIFRTTIRGREEAERIRKLLLVLFPGSRITIDTEDCDSVLRVEGNFCAETVINLVKASDYECAVME
jgi:hypothetical protein